MLRLSHPRFQIIEQSRAFNAVYGGGEANVTISLLRLGLRSSFISKLPKNPLGVCAEQYLNRFGVTTEHMLYGCDRLGIYFLVKGFRFVHQKFFMIASIPPSPQPAWKSSISIRFSQMQTGFM